MTTPPSKAPHEPILCMTEIQGIVTPGFFKPHQVLVYIRIPDSRDVIDNFKSLVGRICDEVSTATETLIDRKHYRSMKSSKGSGKASKQR